MLRLCNTIRLSILLIINIKQIIDKDIVKCYNEGVK
jgi:hypothetical protein